MFLLPLGEEGAKPEDDVTCFTGIGSPSPQVSTGAGVNSDALVAAAADYRAETVDGKLKDPSDVSVTISEESLQSTAGGTAVTRTT